MSAAPKALQRWLLHLVLLVSAGIWLLPTVGLLFTSFRVPADILASGWWTVLARLYDLDQFTLTNYLQVIDKQGLGRSFFNSLAITLPASLLSTIIAAMAAFAFAWLPMAGRSALYALIVGLIVVPLQITFIPILPIYSKLGLSGTFPGIWLAHVGYGLPLIIYLLYNFIATIPKALFECAVLDGATTLQIFLRIVLPISLPALASVFIFQFLWIWNDLLIALIFLGATPNVAPVTLTLANLVTNQGQNWELLTAAAFVSMALPLAVFFSLQRYFVRGILAGTVKE